jgi:DNA-binding response OmpR family regulator
MKNKLILVVDDEQELLELLVDELQMEGAQVMQASNGLEALELIKTHQFHLVITDNNMPKMKGHELIKEVRNFSDIPFLLFVEDDKKSKQYEILNIQGFLMKPFDFDILIKKANSAL